MVAGLLAAPVPAGVAAPVVALAVDAARPPADFESRFQGPARDLVLAHERIHLAQPTPV